MKPPGAGWSQGGSLGGPGDSPWHRGGRGHRSGRGDPRPVPTSGCDQQPSPTHCPSPQQSPFPRPCPVCPPPICSSPGRGRGGTSWSREPSCRVGAWAVTGEAVFLQWSWKTHQRGHRRDEPPRPTGTEPPGLGTLCALPSAQPSTHCPGCGDQDALHQRSASAKGEIQWKKQKLCLGSSPHPWETQLLPGNPLLPVCGARM